MKKTYHIILAALVITAVTSCEKLLNKEPQDQLSIEKTFSDFQGARSALAGAYKSLESTDLYHLNVMIYPDLMGGNVKYSKTSNQVLFDVYNLSQKPLDCSFNSTYEASYDLLNNINNIIKNTPSVPDASEQQKNKIMADAQAMRALIHFNLVNIFARPYNFTSDASHPGVVVNLQQRLYNDPLPQRSTVAQTYTAIINDLVSALQLYNNSTAVFTSGSTQTYFNKNAVKAFLAKVYLYKGDWQNAYTYANEVITTGGYTLLTNANYAASWATRTPSTESIFELALESNFSGNSYGTYFDATSTQYQQFAATNDLLGLYSSSDVRGKTTLFNSQVVGANTYYFTKKYEKGGTNATPVKVFRLSELYLIRAEASALLTPANLTQANADLNMIRLRGDASATVANYTTQATLLDAIYTERRKELAFEGSLLYDLLRTGKSINRVDCNATTCSASNNDYRLIMPITTNTISVNPLLIQNTGY